MGLPSLEQRVRALLNERDYGTLYDPRMATDPTFDANDSESAATARSRVKGFLAEIHPLLYRTDVLAFSHFGASRALIAELLNLSDTEMMTRDVPNSGAFLFARTFAANGDVSSSRRTYPHTSCRKPPRRSRRRLPRRHLAEGEITRLRVVTFKSRHHKQCVFTQIRWGSRIELIAAGNCVAG